MVLFLHIRHPKRAAGRASGAVFLLTLSRNRRLTTTSSTNGDLVVLVDCTNRSIHLLYTASLLTGEQNTINTAPLWWWKVRRTPLSLCNVYRKIIVARPILVYWNSVSEAEKGSFCCYLRWQGHWSIYPRHLSCGSRSRSLYIQVDRASSFNRIFEEFLPTETV